MAGDEIRESEEQKVRRIVAQQLRKLGWTRRELQVTRKGDVRKIPGSSLYLLRFGLLDFEGAHASGSTSAKARRTVSSQHTLLIPKPCGFGLMRGVRAERERWPMLLTARLNNGARWSIIRVGAMKRY